MKAVRDSIFLQRIERNQTLPLFHNFPPKSFGMQDWWGRKRQEQSIPEIDDWVVIFHHEGLNVGK